MGKASRDKGSRFERDVSKRMSKSFNRDLRRVPLSGGLDIRSDIYDPADIGFRFFVECKHREEYTFMQLVRGTSKLFSVFEDSAEKAIDHAKRFKTKSLIPIVVFKGGEFKIPFVLCRSHNLHNSHVSHISMMIHYKDEVYVIVELDEFLKDEHIIYIGTVE